MNYEQPGAELHRFITIDNPPPGHSFYRLTCPPGALLEGIRISPRDGRLFPVFGSSMVEVITYLRFDGLDIPVKLETGWIQLYQPMRGR